MTPLWCHPTAVYIPVLPIIGSGHYTYLDVENRMIMCVLVTERLAMLGALFGITIESCNVPKFALKSTSEKGDR